VTPEVSVKRKTLSVVTLAVALFAAVVLQLTVVNRLPLPGGAVPDLVLLLVTAIAVATTPGVAAVTGFAGGLALDVAPPAAHYAGQYALVFCLAGYAASRVYRAITNTSGEQDRVVAFTVMASAAAAGEAGKAALGMLLSDPDVTTASVSHVLPGAILYDLVLAPLMFLLVARVTRGAVPDRAPAPEFSREQRLASVFRPASTGAAPNLRLAGTGMSFSPRTLPRRVPSLRLSGTGETYRSQPVAGRAPKLRLAGTSSPSLSRTAASFSGSSQFPLAAGRARKLNFAGDLPVRTGARPPRAPGNKRLRATTLGVARLGHPERPGRPRRGRAHVAARRRPDRPAHGRRHQRARGDRGHAPPAQERAPAPLRERHPGRRAPWRVVDRAAGA
jgi:rod shape-determining protein MreD